MGEGHPEQPDRLRAIERALESEVFQTLARDIAPRAEISAIARVHPLDYIETIRAGTPTQGRTAIATRHAQAAYGAERVAIVDFDVHHGNGTQNIFWDDPTVMYASTHEMPHYPGTGSIGERGEHDQIVNAPLRAGDGGEAFREAMEVAILPRVEAFSPDVVVISAGFDAHHRDVLGNLNLIEADYAWVTLRLMEIAKRRCSGRVVSVLEGGYHLDGLARSVAVHVLALMEG
jgi:acetoin utilization deacetylase AcuC-like enzyme